MTAPSRPTVPDVRALWETYAVIDRHRRPPARWRISGEDWLFILHHRMARDIVTGQATDSPAMFGVPVEIVGLTEPRFPELVIICDRRN